MSLVQRSCVYSNSLKLWDQKTNRNNFSDIILMLRLQETFLVIFEIKNYAETEKCEGGQLWI